MARINKSLTGELDAFVENIMEAYDAKGVAVSVFGKEQVYYEKYYGYRDVENKLKMDEDTIFGMASISKSFACLSIMQLVQKGVVDLDGLVSSYVPEFTGKIQKGVKVRHLLSHSAGFFPEKRILAKEVAKELGVFMPETEDITYSVPLAEEGIKRVASRLDNRGRYIGVPGELMSYSNDSFGLIADIVRRYGGESSYSAYVNKNILEPLGMTRTSLEFEAPAKDPNCTMLYYRKDGELKSCRDFYDNAFIMMGGGAVKSTISDLRKYTRLYLNEGGDIISPYHIKEMMKPRQFYRFQQYYGYGLSLKLMDDLTVIGHGGSLTGVSNMFMWSPQLECGVIVFCNTSEVPAAAIADGVMRYANGKSPAKEDMFVDTPWDKATIEIATGFYKSGEGALYEITYDNGEVGLKLGGVNLDVRTVENDMLIINKPYNNQDVILMKDSNGNVWGIRTGGRIIPKGEVYE